jgi:hypothetical protein
MISTRPAWSTGLPAIRRPILVRGGSSVNPTRSGFHYGSSTRIPKFRPKIRARKPQKLLGIRRNEPGTPKEARDTRNSVISVSSVPQWKIEAELFSGFGLRARRDFSIRHRLNDSACALFCQKCRRIELFANAPSKRWSNKMALQCDRIRKARRPARFRPDPCPSPMALSANPAWS